MFKVKKFLLVTACLSATYMGFSVNVLADDIVPPKTSEGTITVEDGNNTIDVSYYTLGIPSQARGLNWESPNIYFYQIVNTQLNLENRRDLNPGLINPFTGGYFNEDTSNLTYRSGFETIGNNFGSVIASGVCHDITQDSVANDKLIPALRTGSGASLPLAQGEEIEFPTLISDCVSEGETDDPPGGDTIGGSTIDGATYAGEPGTAEHISLDHILKRNENLAMHISINSKQVQKKSNSVHILNPVSSIPLTTTDQNGNTRHVSDLTHMLLTYGRTGDSNILKVVNSYRDITGNDYDNIVLEIQCTGNGTTFLDAGALMRETPGPNPINQSRMKMPKIGGLPLVPHYVLWERAHIVTCEI